MIKVENVETFGWMAAIRGMRNSWNSWHKSDSQLINGDISIGPNDLRLMQNLYVGGPSHRKYLRMIHAQMDVLAPLYWWKEFDTYKVGTAVNSTSTMHRIADHKFTAYDFSFDKLNTKNRYVFGHLVEALNDARDEYLKTKSIGDWWQMIQLLPTSYEQLRTIDMNYENVMTIICQRYGHKLDEWRDFCKILKQLPYVEEIGCFNENGQEGEG